LCNSVLQHASVFITENCTETIRDVIYAAIKVDPMSKKLTVIKTEEDGRHFFDNYRYLIHASYPDFITNHKKYR
jgi:hypothetical protein